MIFSYGCRFISPAFHDTIISDSAREFVHDFTLLYRIPSYTVVGEGVWEVWIKVFIPTEQIIPHISSRVRASSMIISVFSTVSSYHIFQVLSFRYFLNSAAPAPHHLPLFHDTRLFLLIGFFRGQNISSRKKIFFFDFSLAVSKYQWAAFSAPREGPSSRNIRTIISENSRCFFWDFTFFEQVLSYTVMGEKIFSV